MMGGWGWMMGGRSLGCPILKDGVCACALALPGRSQTSPNLEVGEG